MPAIVLESSLGSQYEDSPDSYEFPGRYLRFFDPVGRGEQLYAIVYEPRGESGTGRMAYVGMARVVTTPMQTGRRNRAGEDLWRVGYATAAEAFDRPVPREVLGDPVESWLRDVPRGRNRNVATFGRAVRPLSDEDFERILRLAAVNPLLDEAQYALPAEPIEPLAASRERVERIVSVFERRAAFRREVLRAYDHRCAVSGLGLGPVAPSKGGGLLDAAHIQAVGKQGVDSVWNGLALTPTLHRLFDQGLFTVQYNAGELEVLTSPRLDRRSVEVPERGVNLAVSDGSRVLVPLDQTLRPRPEVVEFHRYRVFLST